MTQKELQEILHVQPGSISEILAKLEDKGLILREKDDSDKRKSIIKLTETGRNAKDIVSVEYNDGGLFDALSDEEQGTLKELLKKLLDSWNA